MAERRHTIEVNKKKEIQLNNEVNKSIQEMEGKIIKHKILIYFYLS